MSFILGISIGTIIGVGAMCLLQINDEEKEKNNDGRL